VKGTGVWRTFELNRDSDTLDVGVDSNGKKNDKLPVDVAVDASKTETSAETPAKK
jgi:hypothetical protein